jgi:hypothetical protein
MRDNPFMAMKEVTGMPGFCRFSVIMAPTGAALARWKAKSG